MATPSLNHWLPLEAEEFNNTFSVPTPVAVMVGFGADLIVTVILARSLSQLVAVLR
jgi:hypothetical protein